MPVISSWCPQRLVVLAALLSMAYSAQAAPRCERIIRAEVVALEQAVVLNRYGAFNPAGMLYALRRDVVFRGHPRIKDDTPVTEDNQADAPGYVVLRKDKRPRPIVLRANEGDCLEVRFHNLMMRAAPDELKGSPEQYFGKVPEHVEAPQGTIFNSENGAPTGRALVKAEAVSNDRPWTRAASFHVNGLNSVPISPAQCPVSTSTRTWLCGTDGDNVGVNLAVVRSNTPAAQRTRLERQAGQVLPGQSALYRFYAFREGTYFAYSTAASVGGEGDGGQLGAGLFGAVNVQPRGARWYRSQVTHSDLKAAARAPAPGTKHQWGSLDYDGARYAAGSNKDGPILSMLDARGAGVYELMHTDINAIVTLGGAAPDHHDTTSAGRPCRGYAFGNSCGDSFREFTVIMHDEVKAVQAFPELEQPDNPLHAIKDNMGINYGVGGMGAMVVARNRRTGPTKDCPECRAEEFFLSSWANGDPALVLKWDDAGNRPTGALYPDDPSNVHHSYLNDPVRFRNLHAGPKETHVFHLHAHQWVMDASEPGSTYLDSQTISPGATFSYEIEFGGSGNQNLSPGDSIFHCHLYPHFAQGMWELWRVHDVFEDGSDTRKLPDAEVAGGTENPAVVPLPGSVLALMPTEQFKGYPFYIPGEAGHRPPQPPMDMDLAADGQPVDGGLQRHVLTGWEAKGNRTERALANQAVLEAALNKGSTTARINARRVYAQSPDALTALAEEWAELGGMKLLDPEGEPRERTAMQFHSGALAGPGLVPTSISEADVRHGEWEQERKGYLSERATVVAGQPPPSASPAVFRVNGRAPMRGAPYADPCPANAPRREYRAGVIQTELTVNRHGWFDPQARILALENDIADLIDPNSRTRLPEPLFFRANSGDCIDFKHSNFAPNALALDDFQIYTPTDTIGQHIHLVKFDVTSSDGSGNGWNYEDGTFSPEEVRERVHAYNVSAAKKGQAPLKLKTHPLFLRDCGGDANCVALRERGICPPNAETLSLAELAEKHPFCGAQRTVQRWYADPIFDPKNGKDYTLRTVFTHDHFGPSSHQQHGLYAALVIEPSNSVWLDIGANTLDWAALCSADATQRGIERAKVLGGSNLSDRFDEKCLERQAVVGPDEKRPPLKLREDGGPTATRANIVAPKCLHGGAAAAQRLLGARKDSNPIDPQNAARELDCGDAQLETHDTRREYGLAFADFSLLYNTALEPINPEKRDLSALRFGHRQVPSNRPAPLAISSEDPGTQLINYRNEPLPLRVTDFTPQTTSELGGFDYTQKACRDGDVDCTYDMANAFSTAAHASRDLRIATQPYGAQVSPQTRALLAGSPPGAQLDDALASIEAWRRRFNCALYPGVDGFSDCKASSGERWRLMGDPATPIVAAYEGDPLYVRLIQGAQEAQHVFAMTGQKWLHEPDSPNSGYTNAQPLGISEHFEFNVKVSPLSTPLTDSLYLGSSIDQLWDGMWGLVRSYGMHPARGDVPATPVVTPGIARLNELPGGTIPLPVAAADQNRSTQVCAVDATAPGQPSPYAERLQFDISAVRACDLTNSCRSADDWGKAGFPPQRGIPYNLRIGMDDPNGVVFVVNNQLPGDPAPREMLRTLGNREVLALLREQVRDGKRRIEPLVLRAAAGQCIEVKLRNLLPPVMAEGPQAHDPGSLTRYSDNFMSMITDGFNYNQLRMSSSIGLSAPRVASYGPLADGGNFGANELERRRIAQAESTSPGTAPPRGRAPTPRGAGEPLRVAPLPAQQGNLVPPCREGDSDDVCQLDNIIWYAGDYQLERTAGNVGRQKALPIEFGALPLSSFGDAIKHPAHGAIGALVIGPVESRVCPSTNAAERASDASTHTSATICDSNGRRLYRDFVLVLQDAVDARIKGDPVPNLKGAEEPDDYGVKAVNYRSEPLWARRGGDPSVDFGERNQFDYAGVLSSKRLLDGRCQAGVTSLVQLDRQTCDPETPVFVARAGSEVRLRVVHPGGHTRQQAFALHGHDWTPRPFTHQSTRLAATHADSMRDAWAVQGAYNGIGPLMGADLVTRAGGRWQRPADYLWRSQASFVFDGGIWGLLRVVQP